jgi:outer membrane protein insertion porin family
LEDVNRAALLFSMIGALCLPASAQARLADQQVREIRFDPPALGERFRERVTLQAGQPYSTVAIRESIARLYATGRFAEITVDASPTTPPTAGLVVTFVLQPTFFVGGVGVLGVKDHPTPVQAVNSTKLQLGEPFSEAKRVAAMEAIGKLMVANGYHEAKVSENETPHPDTQQIDLRFTIVEGRQARIGSLQWNGDPGFSAFKLMAKSGLKPGRPATAPAVQNALQKLRKFYQSQQLLSARVDLIDRVYDDKTRTEALSFRLIQGPKIIVRADGVKISDKKLRGLLPFQEEGSADLDLVREGAREFRDFLQSQGYFEADVQGSMKEDLRNGIIEVVYQVDRGPRHRLDRVEIHGNSHFSEQTLLERMSITPQSLTGSGRFSRTLLDGDVATLKDAYRADGFRQVAIAVKVDDDFNDKPGLVHVRLDITEGPQSKVRELRWEGNRQIASSELQRVVTLQAGQPFSESRAALDRDNLLAYYYDRGFPSARFSWHATPVPADLKISDNAASDNVTLVYTIEEGTREYVDRVLVGGLHRTRPGLVQKQIEIKEGQPLSQTERLDTQRNLYDLGVFNRVDMAVQNPDGQESGRTMLLQVEEAGRWSLATGFGAEIARLGGGTVSLDEPQGTATISPRVSFDATRVNFGGSGQTLALKTLVSTIQQRGSITYTAPRILDHPKLTLYLTTLADRTSDVRTFTAERYEASASLAWKRNRSDTLIYRLFYRRVAIDSGSLKIDPSLIPVDSKAARVGGPALTFIRDHRDNPVDSQRGYYFTADAAVAGSYFGSQANFTHLFMKGASYHRIGKNLVLARNTLFGMQQAYGGLRAIPVVNTDGASTIDYTRAIPLAENFFSGGANTERAFNINQAGPRDLTTGFPIGGNALFMNSVELRFPINRPNLGGVLFWDGGNVYNKFGDISFRTSQHGVTDFNYMVHAAGFGVRYRTPIGPVRLDFAWAFNPPQYYGLLGNEDQLLNGTAPRVLRNLGHFQFFFSIGQTY